MTHVIGLFSRVLDYNKSIITLQASGFHIEKVNLTSRDQVVWDVLGHKPQKFVACFAGGGAFLGLVIYGTAALLISWLQSNLYPSFPIDQKGIDIAGILTGITVGASIGVYVGIEKLNEIASIYRQGRRMDGTLIDVRVSRKKVDHVKGVLKKDGACDIRII